MCLYVLGSRLHNGTVDGFVLDPQGRREGARAVLAVLPLTAMVLTDVLLVLVSVDVGQCNGSLLARWMSLHMSPKSSL